MTAESYLALRGESLLHFHHSIHSFLRKDSDTSPLTVTPVTPWGVGRSTRHSPHSQIHVTDLTGRGTRDTRSGARGGSLLADGCWRTALAKGKYYERHLGRKSYLRNMNAHHDHEAEQLWLRMLVGQGRAADPEGCLRGS